MKCCKLGPDPRTWAREDVVTFLRWCEREFDLPGLDLDKFQMNGTWHFLNNGFQLFDYREKNKNLPFRIRKLSDKFEKALAI